MNWLKAKIAILVIAVVWASLIIACLPLMIVAVAYDKRRPNIDWLYSIFLGQDHLVNAILGGDYNTTISAQLGYLQVSGSKSGTISAKFVNHLFRIARNERNHCINAMRKTDKYIFSARRALAGFFFYMLGLYAVYSGFDTLHYLLNGFYL